jgi:hypothetical protein
MRSGRMTRLNFCSIGWTIPCPAALSLFSPPPLQAIVRNNSETVLSLQVAGTWQRAALADRSDDIVAGTARLTLVGYDEKDEQVEFDLGFNILLFASGTKSPSSTRTAIPIQPAPSRTGTIPSTTCRTFR